MMIDINSRESASSSNQTPFLVGDESVMKLALEVNGASPLGP